MTTTTIATSPCLRLQQHIKRRGDSYTENDNGWINTRCPSSLHTQGDHNPSLGFKEFTDDLDPTQTRIGFHCFAGCTDSEILKGYGLTWKDLYSKPNGLFATSMSGKQAQEAPTFADLERYTLIPRQYLIFQARIEEKHLFTYHKKDGAPNRVVGFKIPYYTLDGREHERNRVRKALQKPAQGKDTRFLWNEGDERHIAYGLQDLPEAEKAGYLVVVEGESDRWTLDYHKIPSLGVPGAVDIGTLDGALFANIPTIYVIQEKTDQAGINFPYAVQVQLRKTGYTGDILRVPLRALTGAKDPNELHKQLWNEGNPHDHEVFQTRFQACLDQAKRMDYDTARAALDETIENKDTDALFHHLSTLARLSRAEYLPYEIRIKSCFGKDLNMNTFNSAISEVRKAIAQETAGARKAEEANVEYEKTDTGMVYSTKNGEPVYISNFAAEITADITTDDGAEQTRSYEIEAALYGRRKHFEIPAKEFSRGEWIDEHVGARARVTTGQSMKSHLINAIKYCSIPQEQFHYAHTGWRNVDGLMVYLHGSGCLSQVSQVSQVSFEDLTQKYESNTSASRANREEENSIISQVSQVSQDNIRVCVKLTGPLAKYQFPDERGDLQIAIRRSLCYLDLLSDSIVFPLYCSLWRSVLPDVDYGVHLAGQTGWGKTELVALLQQHFGPSMSAHQLPGSWESTENSLEMLLFQAKDTLVVVDDFKPKGGKVDQDRLHAKADRVFRQLGNGATRGRLTSNLEQRAERRPRCLLISTGEDVPRGQSLKARGVVLTMNERITTGEAAKKLLVAQRDAKSGIYAEAMAAYIEWLAPRIETIQAQLPDEIAAERDRLNIDGHGRSGTNTANMLLGMKYFLRFACECGAIAEENAEAYLIRCKAALKQIACEASQENHQDRPSEQWRRLLITALTSKKAHLVSESGDNPGMEYGWVKSVRTVERDDAIDTEETLRGGGPQIGWVDGDDIYLLPTAAYEAARSIGSTSGDDITTVETTLRKFLAQDKILASTDLGKARKTITVRRRLENSQRDVLHIKRGVLFPDDPPSNFPDSRDLPDSAPCEAASEATLEVSQVVDSNTSESSQVADSEVKKLLADFKKKYEKKKWVFWTAQNTGYANGSLSPAQWYERFKECYSNADPRIKEAAIEALKEKVQG